MSKILKRRIMVLNFRCKKISVMPIFAIFMMLMFFSGCKPNKVTTEGIPVVNMTFDWSQVKGDKNNLTASIYLYPTTGGDPLIYTGVPPQGIVQEILQGDYYAMVYNENLGEMEVSGKDTTTTFIATLPIYTTPKITASTLGSFVPSANYLHLLPGTSGTLISLERSVDITFRPVTTTYTYQFIVNIPTEISVSRVEAVFSGVASQMSMYTHLPLNEGISNIEIPLSYTRDDANDLFIADGSVEILGVNRIDRSPGVNSLYLKIVPAAITPGFKEDYEIDLTDYITNFSDTDLVITVNAESPDPSSPDEIPFDITVVPWDQEDGGELDVEPN